MDFFDILQEARGKSSRNVRLKLDQSNHTDYTAEVDSDEDDMSDNIDDNATDYTEDVESDDDDSNDENSDDNNDDDATDYTEDVETDDDDDDSNDDGDTSADDGTDPSLGETTDYTDDIDNSDSTDSITNDDTSSDDMSSSDGNKSDPDANRQALLIKNVIDLYYSVKNKITILNDISDMNTATNQIIIQVKHNLTDLLTKLYNFTTNIYPNNSYPKNLLIYSKFIEAYKINVEMLRKISAFR